MTTCILFGSVIFFQVEDVSKGNIELSSLLTISKAGAESTGPGECCLNGYKSWKTTTNIPTQRKDSFRDCWCNPHEGYDPQTCNCN